MTETKKEKKVLSKQRLEMSHIDIDVPYSNGTKQLDRVKAVNLSLPEDNPLAGKPLNMTIFNNDLKTFIRGKTVFTADIEETPQANAEYGPNRTIIQAYDDNGEPVSKKKASGAGGGYRRSLEEDLTLESFKNRFAEGQTAIEQVGAFIRTPEYQHMDIDNEMVRIIKKYWQAVERGLDNLLSENKTQVSKQPASTTATPNQKAQDAKSEASKPTEAKKDSNPATEPIKHIGDLLTKASKLVPPVSREELLTALNIGDTHDIKDLPAAWKMANDISKSKSGKQSEANKDWEKMKR